MTQKEIYCSTDIETDGPIPGVYSLLSFATAAYTADGVLVDTFTANLELLPGAEQHPDTVTWWSERPDAWAATRTNLETPTAAMARYVAWLETLPGKPVFVAYPVGFDFMFVYWYLIRFHGSSPFGFSALDIKTFAMAKLNRPYRQSSVRNWPSVWVGWGGLELEHVALSDAMAQGASFCRMLNDSQE